MSNKNPAITAKTLADLNKHPLAQQENSTSRPGDLRPDNSFVDVPAKPSELLQSDEPQVDTAAEAEAAMKRKIKRIMLQHQIERVEYEESTGVYQVYQRDYTNPTTRSLLDTSDPLAIDLLTVEEHMRKNNIKRLV